MGEKIKSLLVFILLSILIYLTGPVIAQGVELIKYIFYGICWIVVILYIFSPQEISFSFANIWQTLKRFLLILMFPGMLIILNNIFNINLINESNILWFTFGPMILGLCFSFLFSILKKLDT
jgi:hypothetical protein